MCGTLRPLILLRLVSYPVPRKDVVMDLEMAFVLGVLIGQWFLLFAIWRALLRLIQVLAAFDETVNRRSTIVNDIIEIPPAEVKRGERDR
jgi:hypothetical protein